LENNTKPSAKENLLVIKEKAKENAMLVIEDAKKHVTAENIKKDLPDSSIMSTPLGMALIALVIVSGWANPMYPIGAGVLFLGLVWMKARKESKNRQKLPP
jgi:hypothetical protein